MALSFTDASSNVVSCGSAFAAAQGAQSLCLWYYPTSLAAAVRFLASKHANIAGFQREWTIRPTTGQVNSSYRGTTNAQARSANSAGNVLTANKWWFLAFTLSSSLVPRVYLGDLGAATYEVSYAIQTTGVALVDDSSYDFRIGNAQDAAHAAPGRIARVAYFPAAELSLGQIQAVQCRGRLGVAAAGWWELGYAGTGTQPDWSGNGNAGTVTGATVADHVPLGSLFGATAGRVPYAAVGAAARPRSLLTLGCG